MSSNQEISVESFRAASTAIVEGKKHAVYNKYSALFLAEAKKAQDKGRFQCWFEMDSHQDATLFGAVLSEKGFNTCTETNSKRLFVSWHKE